MPIKRVLFVLVCAFGGIVAVVLLAGGIMAWRLTAGPVSLGVLTPVMELALNSISGPVRVAVDDAILSWNRSDGILRIRLVKARATSSKEGMVLKVPEVSLALDAGALVRGDFAPTEIDVVRPNLRVVRPADDHWELDPGNGWNGSEPPLSGLMSVLAELSKPDGDAHGLKQIRVEHGSLDVEDRKTGLSWQGKLENTRVWRDDDGLNAQSFLAATSDGQRSDLALTAEYDLNEETLGAGLSFDQIRPAMFAALDPSVTGLAAIDLPVRGTLGLAAGGEGEIDKINFDFLGGVGHLALPVSVAQELGIPDAAQRLAVRGFQLNGTYNSQGATLEIDQLSIDVEAGQTVHLPEPIDHNMPLSAVRARGQYRGDDNTAKLASLELELDGPSIAVSATAEGIGTTGGLKAKAAIVAKNIQTDDFPKYWPSSLGTNAYAWCTERLSDGGISEARIEVTATENAGGVEIASLSGEMDIEGVTVDYLPPMPKARNASGVGTFDLDSLTIKITGAEAVGVSVRGGTAKLYDFGEAVESADIDLSIEGPIRKVLELIDHQPLGYVKAMGLSPSQTGGFSSGRLRLQFPLLADLPLQRLKISADAKLDKVAIANVVLGASVTNGDLTIKLDEKGMDVNGPIVIEKTPAAIVWRENFEVGAPFDTRIDVAIANADNSLLRDLKFEAAPLIEHYVKGPLSINVRYVAYPGGEDTVEIKTDATRASIDFPYFGWNKAGGTAATGDINVKLQGERLIEIPSLVFASEGFDVRGSVHYDDEGGLKEVVLNRIGVGQTDMEATIAAVPGGGWGIDLNGKSFDIGPLVDELQKPDTGDQPVTLGQSPLSITAKLDTVLIDPEYPLKQVSGSIVRDNDLWSLVKMDARVGDRSSLSLRISPEGSGSRSLQVRSSDAGDTLRGLGVYEHMIGGKLKINGSFNDAVDGNPLNGKVKVTDYRITNAPGMAKILSIMALTGILDQLRGKGIGFAIFNAPFTLHNGVLEIKDARASGTELGMTAEGRVANDTANIKGTIVPFYAVNSLLGKIPIVGPMFAGGEKGGGLLAARYSITGPMNDPSVTVNPLSMLTPGFLRNLFNVFDADSGSSDTGKAPVPEPQTEHP